MCCARPMVCWCKLVEYMIFTYDAFQRQLAHLHLLVDEEEEEIVVASLSHILSNQPVLVSAAAEQEEDKWSCRLNYQQ